jgi:hypothetical protein
MEMPEFMVVVKSDTETFANFFSDLDKAEDFRMNSECSMGWYAEVYQRIEGECGMEYQLMYS